jgi:hypothetical protein
LSDFVRSVQVGRTRFSQCCHLIIDLSSHLVSSLNFRIARDSLRIHTGKRIRRVA